MATDIADVFSSSRLSYRAVEDTSEDEAFFHAIQSDTAAYAGSDTGLLKPVTKKESLEHKKYVQDKTLLGVVICLPQTEGHAPLPIGSIYLTDTKPSQAHHRNSFISIDILASYRRKGYGGEAIEWTLDWAFRIAGLHRVGIEAFSYNEGARELYERLGFTYEGCKRELLWFNGGWHDYLSFSMLEGEWKARQERKIELALAKEEKKE